MFKSAKKRIVCVWFTFSLDAGQLLYSVAFARRAFGDEAVLYVFDDDRSPICEEAREKLIRGLRAVVLTLKWDRRGNIKGGEHLMNATELYYELAVEHEAEVVVKCDSDTAILSRSWVDALLNREGACFAGAFCGRNAGYAYGLAYAIKGREVLRRLARDAVDYPASDGAFEDYEVGQRLARIAGESAVDTHAKWARRHSMRLGDNDFMLVDASRAQGAPWKVQDLVKCQVVSVGYNCTPSSESGKVAHRRAQVAMLGEMWRMLEG